MGDDSDLEVFLSDARDISFRVENFPCSDRAKAILNIHLFHYIGE